MRTFAAPITKVSSADFAVIGDDFHPNRPVSSSVIDISTDNQTGVHVVESKRELISNGNPMEAIVGFSRAVRVGPCIAVGGTAPIDESGKTVGVGDVFVQTKQCL